MSSKGYRLIKDVPMLRKGVFIFDFEIGYVYWVDKKGKVVDVPLRRGLAGYLWLLRTEPGFFRRAKKYDDVI